MMRRWVLCLTALCAAWAAAPVPAADTIVRRGSDGPLRGEIARVSRTEVVIRTGLGANRTETTVPANDILRIEWDGDAVGMNLVRNAEEAGRLNDALQGYQKALDEAEDPNVKADLTFLIARTTAKQAAADPSQADDAIRKLQQFQEAHREFYRFFESVALLGETYLAKGDFDNAQQTFQELAEAPWDEMQMAAYIANGRVLLARDQAEPALGEFDKVIAMEGSSRAAVSRKHDALLGKATALQKLNRPSEAVPALEEVIEQTSQENTRTLAEAYLRLGDSLRAAGRGRDALFAYLHVDVLFAKERSQHAEALFHLTRLWADAGQPGRADDAAARLAAEYPNSRWAQQLAGGDAGG